MGEVLISLIVHIEKFGKFLEKLSNYE